MIVKLWSTFNDILGKNANFESYGSFITKLTDIANYFNDHSLANLGMTCQQQTLTLHIQVFLTKF